MLSKTVSIPKGKNKIRLTNSGIESAWLNKLGLMTVVINNENANTELLNLIEINVIKKNRKNCYKKLPEAVPLYLPHELVAKNLSILKKSFDTFLIYVAETGKNPWKKYHEPEIVNYLNQVLIRKINF